MIAERTTNAGTIRTATAKRDGFRKSLPKEEQLAQLRQMAGEYDSKRNGPNCNWCPHSKTVCFYKELSPETRPIWMAIRNEIRYKDGSALFRQGTNPVGVYIVCKSGSIEIIRCDVDGNELMPTKLKAGEMGGDKSFFAGGSYKEDGILRGKEATVVFIDGGKLDRLMRLEPDLAISMLRRMSRELNSAEKRAMVMAFHDIWLKVENILAMNSKNLRVTEQSGILAKMIGTSDAVFSRELKKLKASGKVKVKKGTITLTKKFIDDYNKRQESLHKKKRL